MILFHATSKLAWEKIKVEGLRPSRIGIIYLSPNPKVIDWFGGSEVLLKVETGENKLTAFDDCKEWEVLCWGPIPTDAITLLTIRQLPDEGA